MANSKSTSSPSTEKTTFSLRQRPKERQIAGQTLSSSTFASPTKSVLNRLVAHLNPPPSPILSPSCPQTIKTSPPPLLTPMISTVTMTVRLQWSPNPQLHRRPSMRRTAPPLPTRVILRLRGLPAPQWNPLLLQRLSPQLKLKHLLLGEQVRRPQRRHRHRHRHRLPRLCPKRPKSRNLRKVKQPPPILPLSMEWPPIS